MIYALEFEQLEPEMQLTHALGELKTALQEEHEATQKLMQSRLNKGRWMHVLEGVGRKLKAKNSKLMQDLTPLQFARTYLEGSVHESFEWNLDEQETSMCRAVWTMVAEPHGGLSARFVHHYGDGLEKSLLDVPVNVLYQVRRYVDRAYDHVVSFGKKLGEKKLGVFNKLMPWTMPASQLHMHIKAALEAEDLAQYVRGVMGQDEMPEVRAITIVKEDYDYLFRPIHKRVSLILGALGLLDEETDEVHPNQLMKWILDDSSFQAGGHKEDYEQFLYDLTEVGALEPDHIGTALELWGAGLQERWEEIDDL